MVVEAEKSHDRPPISGSPRKAGGIIQAESAGLRTRGPIMPIPVQGQEKMK